MRGAHLRAALESRGDTDARPGVHARALLEAVLTRLAEVDARARAEPARSSRATCFECGAPPTVAVLRDLPDALGSRSLGCGMCATEWRVTRLTCAHCGGTDAARLQIRAAESLPYVRLDECESCGRYLKTADLRQRGDAVPLVDDMATVELDLWARERGCTRTYSGCRGDARPIPSSRSHVQPTTAWLR